MTLVQPDTAIRLANGLEIEIVSRGEEFLGFGSVRASNGTALRSGRRPMFVEIRTPDAILLTNYRITSRETSPERTVIRLSACGRSDGIEEWMVHETRNRYNTGDWTEEPRPLEDVALAILIEPLNRTIGGETYEGFTYQYTFNGEHHPIYKILDRATWELGATATGNEFWMRNCFVPSIVKIENAEQFHSTEWYMPDAANPNIFQFLPLQTELQGFSFTSADSGTLLTWPNKVSHVRSLFEKPRGNNEIVHWHEHCGDLATHFASTPMEVLFRCGKLDRVGRFNAYEAAKEMVHETLHAELGMRRERIKTYGQIEEWGNADIDRYARLGLPKLLEAGVKTVYIANHFENNMNTFGVSNMCCTVDYKFAETVGSDKIQAFCQQAHEGGAEVEMWANTSVSSLTYILAMRNAAKQRIDFPPYEGSVMHAFKQSQNAFIRNPSGAIEADHYTPVFCVMNLREPVVHDYWMMRWREAKTIGLDGIFLDSSFNLSSDKFHWCFNTKGAGGATADQTHLLGFYRPAQAAPQAILSEYRAHLDLMVEMQNAGYHYCNEDLGVFGTHRHGPGADARLDSLPIWSDCIATFDPETLHERGADVDDVFFKGLAYRMMWSLIWDIDNDCLTWRYSKTQSSQDKPTEWQLTVLNAFNKVEHLLQNRKILANETGVVYSAEGKQVLWAFADTTLQLDKTTTVHDLLSGKSTVIGELSAAKHTVYLIE